ncbi:hypothetical protein RM844_32505, partial [Streptomyces sp. DSM 44915]
ARTQAIRLLEDGRIEELAALLDGAGEDDQTFAVLTKLAAQHNQQRSTQSIADDRYEFRWEKAVTPLSGAEAGDSSWILIGDESEALKPLVDTLTARGQQYRFLQLPASDADEVQLAATLRAAAAGDSTLRIVHVAALDSGATPSMRSLLRMQHQV